MPLSDVDSSTSDQSIGTLLGNATSQMSSLFRSELELAKTELAASAKKGAMGGGLFGVAGVILLYSSFFFFFFVAALIAVWLPWWAGFLIVFGIMVLTAGLLAFVGFLQVRKIGAPKKTIESVSSLKSVLPSKNKKDEKGGLYS